MTDPLYCPICGKEVMIGYRDEDAQGRSGRFFISCCGHEERTDVVEMGLSGFGKENREEACYQLLSDWSAYCDDYFSEMVKPWIEVELRKFK